MARQATTGRPPRTPARVWLVRALGVALLLFTFGYVPHHLHARSGFARYLELRAELQRLRAHNDRLRDENEKLARQAESLRTDMRAIEGVARDELGWVRAGEILVDLREPRR
jgi:cell division protein FtsB